MRRRQHRSIRFGEDVEVRRSHQAVACRKRYARELGKPQRLLCRSHTVESQVGRRKAAICFWDVLAGFEVFINQTVPKRLRLLVSLTKPLWRRRAERAFMLSGGWMIPWRGCPSVGLKPQELLAQSKLKLGERLFVRVPNFWEKIQHLTCHELVHACTAHLRLPFWFNEGIAMRAVDHMVGYPTVLKETRSMVQLDLSFLSSRSYRRLKPSDYDRIKQLYATGYWVARKLEKENPSIFVDLLKRKRSVREVTRIIGSALSFSPVGGGAS